MSTTIRVTNKLTNQDVDLVLKSAAEVGEPTKEQLEPAAGLSIGNVVGGATASASISNNKLDLTLPKGDKGDKGDTGPQGATGATGADAGGWSMKLVDDASTIPGKVLRKVVDWIGGLAGSTKPNSFIGQWLSDGGFTLNPDLAINYLATDVNTITPLSVMAAPNKDLLYRIISAGQYNNLKLANGSQAETLTIYDYMIDSGEVFLLYSLSLDEWSINGVFQTICKSVNGTNSALSFSTNSYTTIDSNNNIVFNSHDGITPINVFAKHQLGEKVFGNLENFEMEVRLISKFIKAGGQIGFKIGLVNSQGNFYGIEFKGHGGADNFFVINFLAISNLFINTVGLWYVDTTKEVIISLKKDINMWSINISQDGKQTYSTQFLSEINPISGQVNTCPLMNNYGIQFIHGEYILTGFRLTTTDTNKSILCVGDSITQSGVADLYSHGYAQLLKEALPGVGVFCGASSTTETIRNAINTIIRLRPYKVLLLIGINDILDSVPIAVIKENIIFIINALNEAGIQPILIKQIPYSQTVSDIISWYDTLANIKKIDFNTPMQTNGAPLIPKAQYMGDSIHPNTSGHLFLKNILLEQWVNI